MRVLSQVTPWTDGVTFPYQDTMSCSWHYWTCVYVIVFPLSEPLQDYGDNTWVRGKDLEVGRLF